MNRFFNDYDYTCFLTAAADEGMWLLKELNQRMLRG